MNTNCKIQKNGMSPQPKPPMGKSVIEEGKSPQPKPQSTKPGNPSK